MTREETVEFLVGQLEKLREKDVAYLMRTNKINELWEIAKKLEFSPLETFLDEKHLGLKICEIPKGLHYELAFYISQSFDIYDYMIFEDDGKFMKLLAEKQEELAARIANTMIRYSLCECTIPELLHGRTTR